MSKFLKETLIFAGRLALFFLLFILLFPVTVFAAILGSTHLVFIYWGDLAACISFIPILFLAIMYYYVMFKILGITFDDLEACAGMGI